MVFKSRILDITEDCPVDIYLSANDGARMWWPWRMQPPAEASATYRGVCDHYIIDSEPQSPSVTNEEVLDCADALDADGVLLVDYFPFEEYDSILYDAEGEPKDPVDVAAFERLKDEYDNAAQASVESVSDGLALAADHPFDGTIWTPLQAPYIDSYEELGCPESVAIGGLKDSHPSEKIRAARELREYAGDSVRIHGLGWGATDELVREIRNRPDLVDSVDSRSPSAAAMNIERWAGDEVSTPTAAFTLGFLLEAARRMNPNMSNDPEPSRNGTLDEFTEMKPNE